MTALTNPSMIYDLCAELLHTGEQALLDNGLVLPDHRFVSWEPPAWDCCAHLVAHATPLRPARAIKRTRASARSATGNLSISEVDVILTYIGCAAIGDPIPGDSAIDDNAAGIYPYVWSLWQGVVCSFTAEAINSTFGEGCHVISIEQGQPHPPIGGCTSFVITVTVQLS